MEETRAASTLGLNVNDRFSRELPADPSRAAGERQVPGACFSFVQARIPSDPSVLHVSPQVAEMVGIHPDAIASELFRDVFTGTAVIPDTEPYAMRYGGHQFGNWAGQLGDGRAINLAEVERNGEQWALQLKGAGKTPYSRGADGLAVLRSSVREHLCSEAMHHLGVPSTRSLCLSLTGDLVSRDMLYDGNPEWEKGAIVCRVARSFVRFGNFQILAADGDLDALRKLVAFTIKHHYPEIGVADKDGVIALYRTVSERSIEMVTHWQRVGFVHGVMNTDNMSILGDTIDFGPYGWLEGYDHGWTPNTTDRQNKRYRFGQQPRIVMWNLVQLASALYPLVSDPAPFQQILQDMVDGEADNHLHMMRSKLGLATAQAEDADLIDRLEKILHLTETDMTIFFRKLKQVGRDYEIETDGRAFLKPIADAFYEPTLLTGEILEEWRRWMTDVVNRLAKETLPETERQGAMDRVNPKYVLRNYMAQLAIDGADRGDVSLIEELVSVLQYPYDEQPESEKWFAKRPEWARDKVGCSMLSCSS